MLSLLFIINVLLATWRHDHEIDRSSANTYITNELSDAVSKDQYCNHRDYIATFIVFLVEGAIIV